MHKELWFEYIEIALFDIIYVISQVYIYNNLISSFLLDHRFICWLAFPFKGFSKTSVTMYICLQPLRLKA
jgi:hypothetical protein